MKLIRCLIPLIPIVAGCSKIFLNQKEDIYEYVLENRSYRVKLKNGLIVDTSYIRDSNSDLVEATVWRSPVEHYSSKIPRNFHDSIISGRNIPKDTVTKGSDTLMDSRTTESILKVFRVESPKLRHTYNDYLRKRNGFKGRITYKISISPSGKIIKLLLLEDTTNYKEFALVITQKIFEWRFGSVENKANDIVTVPFTFSE